MIFILTILIVAVIIGWLPIYHNQIILRHLEHYKCNPQLYKLIRAAKTQHNDFTEAIRIETSVKDVNAGRYVIPILLSEFKTYRKADRVSIIKHLGFTMSQYREFIDDPKIRVDTDIILGVDLSKGKLYLDYGDSAISLKCLESNGKVKNYIKETPPDSGNLVEGDVLRVETKGKIAGYHYRIDTPYKNVDGDYVYWVARSSDGTKTYYTRPYLPLIDLVDFIALIGSKNH